MVYNPKREGWEMPGGTIEEGETPEQAAAREFKEESGYGIDIIGCRALDDCYVCLGYVEEKRSEGEMESRFFRSLPSSLSFTAEEYEEVLAWGKRVIEEEAQDGRGV